MVTKAKKISFNTVQHTFFFALIIGFGIAFWYLISPFAYALFWAAVLAVMFHPVYRRLNALTHLPMISSLITVIMVVVFVFIPILLTSYMLINESISLYNQAISKEYMTQVNTFALSLQDTPLGPYIAEAQLYISENSTSAIQSITSSILNSLRSITTTSVKLFLHFFIMLYALFFLLKDGHRFLNRLLHLSPLGDNYEILLYERFTSTVRATLKSTVIIGGIQGIIGGIAFALAGIPNVILWGFLFILLGIIPAVGPSLIIFPAGIIMLLMGNIWSAVIILIGGLFVTTIDNILRPPLVGKDTQLHPLIVFFSTIGGLATFGIPGFIIGPIIAALFISILSIYDYYYRRELNKN